MKRIVLAFCFLLGCASPGTPTETQEVASTEENTGAAQENLSICISYCTPCTYLDSRCEPVRSECFNIETNSVPYICSPGDVLPSGKSCFGASTNNYEFCCCNTGTCIPN